MALYVRFQSWVQGRGSVPLVGDAKALYRREEKDYEHADMQLSIYNTLTRRKEEFNPLRPGQVGIYVCGPTVYDHSHVGHARAYTVFDIVTRTLRSQGYRVTYVRNITDVDDKIIKKAKEENCSAAEVAERYTRSFHEDMAALHILPPDVEPRATETIPEILTLIQELIAKQRAYVAGGDVYYSVPSFQAYGRLSKKPLDELQAGARVAVGEQKKDPLDFALWKAAKAGEPAWESPWGKGRPGWHIECSAMSRKYLGATFDIHGGGLDLVFPHHENEIAQSEGASGQPFVRYWIHNGFVQVNHVKMSKSLGNFFVIKEALQKAHPEAVRLFLLGTHYRSPLDFSWEGIEDAGRGLTRLYNALRAARDIGAAPDAAVAEPFWQQLRQALSDDFNTPRALATLFDAAKECNRVAGSAPAAAVALADFIGRAGRDQLGLMHQDAEAFFQGQTTTGGIAPEEIERLIAARRTARATKDFARADQIRKELEERGVLLEDKPGGITAWKRQG